MRTVQPSIPQDTLDTLLLDLDTPNHESHALEHPATPHALPPRPHLVVAALLVEGHGLVAVLREGDLRDLVGLNLRARSAASGRLGIA